MMSVDGCPKVSEFVREWHDEVVKSWSRNDAAKIHALSYIVRWMIQYIEQREEASR